MTLAIQPKQFRIREELRAPSWALELAGDSRIVQADGLDLDLAESDGAALISIHLPRAVDLDAVAFQKMVGDAYRSIRTVVSTLSSANPVRFWNHIPAIHQPMDERRDRYMVFNAARYQSLIDWFGGEEILPGRLPAASGVGHDGDELVIHLLALGEPGRAIENPRQIPAFRYSPKYGPVPPCFSRATMVRHPRSGREMLLVAGTASIRGQESMHVGNVNRQLEETLENLDSLLKAWHASADFESFSDLRVYHSDPQHRRMIEQVVVITSRPTAHIEVMSAQLCRAELLVEIEGVAVLPMETAP